MNYPPELYAAVHDGTEGDLDFYRSRCEGAGSVLELACGYGRVLAALSDAADSLVGLDSDAQLLSHARHRAPVAQLVEGDMRDFDLGRTFDRILIPHTSLYCLLEEADVQRCLRSVAHHLAPGGQLLFDAYDADEFHRETLPEDLDDNALIPVRRVEAQGRGWTVFERSTWRRDSQRIDATYVHVCDDGQTVEATIAQRYVLTEQLPGLLDPVGLELVDLGIRFGPDDENAVWAATAVHQGTG